MTGELISELVLANIKIWHTATQLKDEHGRIRSDSLSWPASTKIAIHAKTREQNARRAQLRYQIDQILDADQAVQDTKVNYLKEK